MIKHGSQTQPDILSNMAFQGTSVALKVKQKAATASRMRTVSGLGGSCLAQLAEVRVGL